MRTPEYKVIDMQTYTRKEHFQYFCSLAYPYAGMTVNVDVTELVTHQKRRGYSFYLLFMHAVALAADEIPQLRQRIREGQIIEYTACPTSHVELLADETYTYCTLYHEQMDVKAYMKRALAAREDSRKRSGLTESEDALAMYFISSLPWVHYSSLIQPVGRQESNPRITWGKYEEDSGGRLQLPVTILVHHGLADGLHMGLFYEKLKQRLTTLAVELSKIK